MYPPIADSYVAMIMWPPKFSEILVTNVTGAAIGWPLVTNWLRRLVGGSD